MVGLPAFYNKTPDVAVLCVLLHILRQVREVSTRAQSPENMGMPRLPDWSATGLFSQC